MNYNRIILGGNLTRDPKGKDLPSGTKLAEFGLANNRKRKGGSGSDSKGDDWEVMFIDCVAFGKTAELILAHFAKGKPIFLEGRLVYETWESDGQKHRKHKIIVDQFCFVGSKADSGDSVAGPSVADAADVVVPF